MFIFRHWLTALIVFYWCLISPIAFACEAFLKYTEVPGFVDRGALGSKESYVQRVYSGNQMSYSTIIFSPEKNFDKTSLVKQTAKSIVRTVSAATKISNLKVKILNTALLPQIDERLAFLSYLDYSAEGSINVEASAAIRTDKCWSILRFSALKKQTKDESLNYFANLIRATQLIK